jgi:hypothetical protein
MYDASTRFTSYSTPALTGVGPTQYVGQPGVSGVWPAPAIARSLIVWNSLPFCPPAPWYITERPIYIPGQGNVLTTTNPISANPQPSVAP